jgi:hypothetical protein
MKMPLDLPKRQKTKNWKKNLNKSTLYLCIVKIKENLKKILIRFPKITSNNNNNN